MTYDFSSTRRMVEKFFPNPVLSILVYDILDRTENDLSSSEIYDLDVIWKTPELRDEWLNTTFNKELYVILVDFMNQLLFGSHSKTLYSYEYPKSVPDTVDPTITKTVLTTVEVPLSKTITEVYRSKIEGSLYHILSILFKYFYMINSPEFHAYFPEFAELANNYFGKMERLPRNYLIAERFDLKPYFAGETYSILEDFTKLRESDGPSKFDIAAFYVNNISIYDRVLRKIWEKFREFGINTGTVIIPTEADRITTNPDGTINAGVSYMVEMWTVIFDALLLLTMSFSDTAYYDTMKRKYSSIK